MQKNLQGSKTVAAQVLKEWFVRKNTVIESEKLLSVSSHVILVVFCLLTFFTDWAAKNIIPKFEELMDKEGRKTDIDVWVTEQARNKASFEREKEQEALDKGVPYMKTRGYSTVTPKILKEVKEQSDKYNNRLKNEGSNSRKKIECVFLIVIIYLDFFIK